MEQNIQNQPCTCDDIALYIFGTKALCAPCKAAYIALVEAEYYWPAIEQNRAARIAAELEARNAA